jgi:hypothetical protein
MSTPPSSSIAPEVTATDSSPGTPSVDAAGEIFSVPQAMRLVWIFLVAILVGEAAHEVFGLPGPYALYEDWFHASIVVASALLCLARAAYEPRGRGAWLSLGLGLAFWGSGTVLWDILYEANPNPPYPSPADVLWLAWYPFTALGIGLLIRARVTRFELHRWMDGLAVMLLVFAACFPLILQPAEHYLHHSELGAIVDFGYPVLDTLLLGAILGVFGLLSWRPGKVWLLLGLGILINAGADAAFAVQQAHGIGNDDHYSFLWAAGALLIGYAAWVAAPHTHQHVEMFGWQAIALPLVAQLLAVGLQACSVFLPVWDTKTDRIITLVVLVIATFQIILARPRLARWDLE